MELHSTLRQFMRISQGHQLAQGVPRYVMRVVPYMVVRTWVNICLRQCMKRSGSHGHSAAALGQCSSISPTCHTCHTTFHVINIPLAFGTNFGMHGIVPTPKSCSTFKIRSQLLMVFMLWGLETSGSENPPLNFAAAVSLRLIDTIYAWKSTSNTWLCRSYSQYPKRYGFLSETTWKCPKERLPRPKRLEYVLFAVLWQDINIAQCATISRIHNQTYGPSVSSSYVDTLSAFVDFCPSLVTNSLPLIA